MKTSLIFKICGLFLAASVTVSADAPHGGDILMDTDKPLSILHGEYQIDVNNMRNYRPTWASVWPIIDRDRENGAFHIATWPPKYCHAIYICPLNIQTYSDTENFRTVEQGICEDEYIKFYPHAKKLFLKRKNDTAEDAKYWTNNRLVFDIAPDNKAKIHVMEWIPETQAQFAEMIKKPNTVEFDLNGKELLILTNSRMCQVNKIGSDFMPFFRKAIQNQTVASKFPEWLTDGSTLVPTDYLPPVKRGPSAKSVDLLAYLKNKTHTTSLGKLVKTCEPVVGWRAGGRRKPSNSQFKRVSVSSYDVNVNMGQFSNPKYKKFTLNVEKCHWFRMWFSPDVLMKDYKQMNLSDTVDFFLNEGFYISPESDEALPLPGVNEMSKFTFVVSGINDPNNLIDMGYGEARGAPIYHDQFKIPHVERTSFKIHIIKAPGCEINMEARPGLFRDSGVPADNNMWQFGKCVFSFFT